MTDDDWRNLPLMHRRFAVEVAIGALSQEMKALTEPGSQSVATTHELVALRSLRDYLDQQA